MTFREVEQLKIIPSFLLCYLFHLISLPLLTAVLLGRALLPHMRQHYAPVSAWEVRTTSGFPLTGYKVMHFLASYLHLCAGTYQAQCAPSHTRQGSLGV